jgi:hypothetical protein
MFWNFNQSGKKFLVYGQEKPDSERATKESIEKDLRDLNKDIKERQEKHFKELKKKVKELQYEIKDEI